jgi:predicted nucleotidyltransferase
MEVLDQPTPYADVNLVLQELLESARPILGEQFVGMYLYGSLASGDFDPETSDIDFVVVTNGNLPAETVAQLQGMHARLHADDPRWARKLEGAYLPQSDLRRYDPASMPYPFLNEGRFYMAAQGSDWVIQRHVLREQGVMVAGPRIRDMIDPVRPDDLRRAVLGVLHEWWAPILEDPAFIREGGHQAFAVLTMCRALYTLEHGAIASKPVCAGWAKGSLGAQWEALITWALSWSHGRQPDRKLETLAFVKFTLERSQRFEIEGNNS